MSFSILGTAYEVLAKALKLKQVKNDIFIDPKGHKFILDKYGFHTVNQKANIDCIGFNEQLKIIEQKQTEANIALANATQLNKEAAASIIGKKTKRSIKLILESHRLTPEQKIQKIMFYLNQKPPTTVCKV